MSVTVPTVQSSGDTHWNRMQDQTGASTISLGGGVSVPATTCSTGSRSPIWPTDRLPTRAPRRSKMCVQVHTYDAEMGRTGGGVLNTTGRSGANVFRDRDSRSSVPTSSLVTTSSCAFRTSRMRHSTGGRLAVAWVVNRQKQDVLLGRWRGLPGRSDAERAAALSDAGMREGISRACGTRKVGRSSSTIR
jgi:hypothetical protein